MKRNLIKIISLLLAAVIMLLAFAACGKSDEPLATKKRNSLNPSVKTEATEPAEETNPVPGTPEPPKTDTPKTEAPKTEAPKTEAPVTDAPVTDKPGGSFTPTGFVPGETAFNITEPVEILNNDDFRFTLKDIVLQEDADNYLFTFIIENKKDVGITFRSNNFVMNGYTFDYGGIYEYVEAGSTEETTYPVDFDDLSTFKISGFDVIELLLYVYDDNYEDVYRGVVSFSPTGIDASELNVPDRLHTEGETVVYEDDVFQVVLIGINKSYYGDCILFFYCENKTDEARLVSFDNIIVNEWDFAGSDSLYLNPHIGGYGSISVYSEELEEVGFTKDLTEMSLTFGGYVYSYNLPDYEDATGGRWNFDVVKDGYEKEIPDCPFRSTGVKVSNGPYELIFTLDTSNDQRLTLRSFINNGSDKKVYVDSDDFMINGEDFFYMIYFGCSEGCKALDETFIYYSFLSDKGVTHIDTISFTALINDGEGETIAEIPVVINVDFDVPAGE